MRAYHSMPVRDFIYQIREIAYCQPGRLPIWREFPTRDAAMALIASRRGAA